MDDLEFRRRLLADPNDNSQEMINARNASLANRKLSDELMALDSQLEKAMKVDVPDDLADRILFRQTGQASNKSPWNLKAWKPKTLIAMAASIAFIIGLLSGQYTQGIFTAHPHNEIANLALEHVYNEAPFIDHIDEAVSLTQVNAKLSPFGSQLTSLPGHIYYVNHCGFGDQNALHMVMSTQHGKVTVFIVPVTSQRMTTFSDNTMSGVVLPTRDASLIVLGEKGQDVAPIARTLEADLKWEI